MSYYIEEIIKNWTWWIKSVTSASMNVHVSSFPKSLRGGEWVAWTRVIFIRVLISILLSDLSRECPPYFLYLLCSMRQRSEFNLFYLSSFWLSRGPGKHGDPWTFLFVPLSMKGLVLESKSFSLRYFLKIIFFFSATEALKVQTTFLSLDL